MEYESPSQSPHLTMDERLKMLYPMVNEEETPLPRCWSTKARRQREETGDYFLILRINTITSDCLNPT